MSITRFFFSPSSKGPGAVTVGGNGGLRGCVLTHTHTMYISYPRVNTRYPISVQGGTGCGVLFLIRLLGDSVRKTLCNWNNFVTSDEHGCCQSESRAISTLLLEHSIEREPEERVVVACL